MTNITAIIVTHNSAKTLSSCMQGLRDNNVSSIIVIDTDSQDASAARARELGITEVYAMPNRGFGAGCNLGASKASSEYLLFINPDARLQPGSLAHAMSQWHEGVAVLGMRLIDANGVPEPWSFGDEITLISLFGRRLNQKMVNKTTSIAWVSGGAMIVARKAFEQVDGFDEDFFMYWEDVDLCKRLRAKGWKVVADPRALVWHDRGASSLSSKDKTARYDESADRYFQKHYATTICLIQRFLRRIHRLFSPLAR